MLCLGLGSNCDVCLEPFGSNQKAPCVIVCGHVFCLDCLNHITRPSCPLCRVEFDPGTHTKLHVEIDSPPVHAFTGDDLSPIQKAKIFQDSIASIANEGSTEERLKQLIAECTEFLHNQPRHQFQELRVSNRMVKYLYETRAKMRSHTLHIEELKAQSDELDEENARLKESLAQLEMRRQEEQGKLHRDLDQVQHDLEKANRRIDLDDKRYTQLEVTHQQLIQLWTDANNTRRTGFPYVPQEFEMGRDLVPEKRLQVTAAADPGFLISPIPDFTCETLPSIHDTPLPDALDTPLYTPRGCGAAGCPHSCDCRPTELFQEEGRSVTRRASVAHLQPSPAGYLSITAPATRSRRPHSRSSSLSRHASRSSSPAVRPAVTTATLTPPPSANSLSTSYSSESSVRPSGPSSVQSPPELRNRLRDILGDGRASTSTLSLHSLSGESKASSYNPASQLEQVMSSSRRESREKDRSSSPPRPRSRSRRPQTSAPVDIQPRSREPEYDVTHGGIPPAGVNPSSYISHASKAAQEMERTMHKNAVEERRRSGRDKESFTIERSSKGDTSARSLKSSSTMAIQARPTDGLRIEGSRVSPTGTKPMPVPGSNHSWSHSERDWTSQGSNPVAASHDRERDRGRTSASASSFNSASQAYASQNNTRQSQDRGERELQRSNTHSSSFAASAGQRPVPPPGPRDYQDHRYHQPQHSIPTSIGSSRGKTIASAISSSIYPTSLAA